MTKCIFSFYRKPIQITVNEFNNLKTTGIIIWHNNFNSLNRAIIFSSLLLSLLCKHASCLTYAIHGKTKGYSVLGLLGEN